MERFHCILVSMCVYNDIVLSRLTTLCTWTKEYRSGWQWGIDDETSMELMPTQSLLKSAIMYHFERNHFTMNTTWNNSDRNREDEVMMLDSSKISELQCKDPLDTCSYSVEGKYLCAHYNDTIHNILIKIIHGLSHDMNWYSEVHIYSTMLTLLAVALLFGSANAALPQFSWDTLPVFFHSSNSTGQYNDDALKVIAKFQMVTIEKWMGLEVKIKMRWSLQWWQ